MIQERPLKRIRFDVPRQDEIENAISVVQVMNPASTVLFAKNNSMYDTRMGAFRNVRCATCGQGYAACPGHCGHIRLHSPCLNPSFIGSVLSKLLARLCARCSSTDCGCGKRKKTVKMRQAHRGPLRYQFEAQDGAKVSIQELYQMLRGDPEADKAFLKSLVVLPVSSRPPNLMGGQWRMDPISRLYLVVLKRNIALEMRRPLHKEIETELHEALQGAVDVLFDTGNSQAKSATQAGGLRQRLDGKQGRLRMNLMGKRTEFSARSVLSGDPKLGVNEVGVPQSVADDLTIPVRVNRFNIQELLREKRTKYVVRNGERFDARVAPAQQLQIGDVVERCLRDGDLVAVNRQPTLHRGSIVACYVRVFPCSTFRLNYSTMITLNADTDGDEINLHVPQDLESRAELEQLMLASTNIVCSQASRPLVGCTQDALLGCYLLSRETRVNREFALEMLYAAHVEQDESDLWDRVAGADATEVHGAALVSMLLEDLGIEVPGYSTEGFQVRQNRCSGTLDKAVVGVAENSLLHHVFLSHGHLKAAMLLHKLQLVAGAYLDRVGFSVGVQDCVPDQAGEIHFDDLNADLHRRTVLGTRSEAREEAALCDALGALTKLPASTGRQSALLQMIQGGSKGSLLNFNQITRCVGQQLETEGRIARRFKDRCLPHFPKFDTSVESRGLVRESFVRGLGPAAFFFHAMGGRIGLIDTACKTSVTGAQHRRLVKSLEALVVQDAGGGERLVVNSSTGSVVQFAYGEDNLDGTYLKSFTPKINN